jgi:hypothetical protein
MKMHEFAYRTCFILVIVLGLAGCGRQAEQTSTEPTEEGAQGTPEKAGETGAAPTAEKKEPPPPAPKTATLAEGTAIKVITSTAISTKTNKTGDPFEASLAEPIVVDDWVIAKKGAAVSGIVADSDPGGRVKGVASISVKLKSLELADGSTVALSTAAQSVEAKSTKKKDATRIGITSGVGAAIGAIAGGGKGAAIGAGVGAGAGTAATMATRGDPAVIPSESSLNFKLSAPLVVTESK